MNSLCVYEASQRAEPCLDQQKQNKRKKEAVVKHRVLLKGSQRVSIDAKQNNSGGALGLVAWAMLYKQGRQYLPRATRMTKTGGWNGKHGCRRAALRQVLLGQCTWT